MKNENGILSMGSLPFKSEEDADLFNAGKATVALATGSTVFDSGLSFDIVRGVHIGAVFLGATEDAGNGDLANWMDGAMDLVSGTTGSSSSPTMWPRSAARRSSNTTVSPSPERARSTGTSRISLSSTSWITD